KDSDRHWTCGSDKAVFCRRGPVRTWKAPHTRTFLRTADAAFRPAWRGLCRMLRPQDSAPILQPQALQRTRTLALHIMRLGPPQGCRLCGKWHPENLSSLG